MDHSEIEDIVRNILATALGKQIELGENINRETESKWDSLKHVEIVFSIEDLLSIRFEEEELTELNSLATIVSSAVRHYGS